MKTGDRMLLLLTIAAVMFTSATTIVGDCTLQDGKCKGIRGKCPGIDDMNCNPLPGTLLWVKVTSFGNHDYCANNGMYDDGKQCCLDPETSRVCAQANFYQSGADCFAGIIDSTGVLTSTKAHPGSDVCGPQI